MQAAMPPPTPPGTASATRGKGEVVSPPKRVGRPAMRRLTLLEAAELCADLADLNTGKLLAAIERAPLSFFADAYKAGDAWRVPERSVYDWLGTADEVWSVARFARALDRPVQSVQRMVRAGVIKALRPAGELRIPRSEFYRLLHEGEATPSRPRFSFFGGTARA